MELGKFKKVDGSSFPHAHTLKCEHHTNAGILFFTRQLNELTMEIKTNDKASTSNKKVKPIIISLKETERNKVLYSSKLYKSIHLSKELESYYDVHTTSEFFIIHSDIRGK